MLRIMRENKVRLQSQWDHGEGGKGKLTDIFMASVFKKKRE